MSTAEATTKRSYVTSAQTLGISLKIGDKVQLKEGDKTSTLFVVRSGGTNTRVADRPGVKSKDESRLVATADLTLVERAPEAPKTPRAPKVTAISVAVGDRVLVADKGDTVYFVVAVEGKNAAVSTRKGQTKGATLVATKQLSPAPVEEKPAPEKKTTAKPKAAATKKAAPKKAAPAKTKAAPKKAAPSKTKAAPKKGK